MVSVVMLGVCGAALLRLVGASGAMADISTQKLALLNAVRSNLQEVRSSAATSGSLATGTVTITPTVGRGISASIVRRISKVASSHNLLYLAEYTTTWTGGTGGRRSGSFKLSTQVVAARE